MNRLVAPTLVQLDALPAELGHSRDPAGRHRLLQRRQGEGLRGRRDRPVDRHGTASSLRAAGRALRPCATGTDRPDTRRCHSPCAEDTRGQGALRSAAGANAAGAIKRRHGFRDLTRPVRAELSAWLEVQALGMTDGHVLLGRLLDEMRADTLSYPASASSSAWRPRPCTPPTAKSSMAYPHFCRPRRAEVSTRFCPRRRTPAKAACPGYASRRRGLAAALECIKPAIRQARDAGLEVEVQKVVRPAGSTLI